MELKIYTNDNDYVVAYSQEDAVKVWEEYVDDKRIEGCYGEIDDWREVGENMTILQEDLPRPEDIPEGGRVIVETKRNHWAIEATAEAWVKHNGRGWLCSWDW